jgi:hypothetical protein
MHHAGIRERALRAVAIVLMLAGAAMLVAEPGGAVAFALVAIGIALTVVVEADRRRRRGATH